MNEVLNIKTTKEKFFFEYLTLKKPILDMIVSRITGKIIKIPMKLLNAFSLLLYYNYLYRDMEEEDKWQKIFDIEHRKEYIKRLDITQSQLNTYFSILRSYKILNGKSINKPFIIYPDTDFELTFKFLLNGEK